MLEQGEWITAGIFMGLDPLFACNVVLYLRVGLACIGVNIRGLSTALLFCIM